MGLDTVELLIRIEKYFDIAIPDPEAAKIVTVQDFVDCVYSKVSLHPTEKCKSQILFYKLRGYFIAGRPELKNDITPDAKIRELIQTDLKETWMALEDHLQLDLPSLSELDMNAAQEKEIKFLGLTVWTRPAPVTAGTIGQLVNWSLALNHEKLIDPRHLFNKADIARIIIGIVSDSSGVPLNEIKLEHGICNDLGMD